MQALAALRRRLGRSQDMFAIDLGLPSELLRRIDCDKPVTAAEWTALEAALGHYLTPARIEDAAITQDAVDELLEHLPFEWQTAANREMEASR